MKLGTELTINLQILQKKDKSVFRSVFNYLKIYKRKSLKHEML